jgi:transposase-like protein
MSKATNKFSPEVRERAVRLVLGNEGQHGSRRQAAMSISAKIGCAPQTLNGWVKKSEVASGKRVGVPTDMAEKMKALERENREAGRGWHRTFGRRRRRQRRQRFGGTDQWSIQGRSHSPSWAVAQRRGRRICPLEWVDGFNNRRLLEPTGNIPPAEAEANFHAALEAKDMAA